MPYERPVSPSRALADAIKEQIETGSVALGASIGSVRQIAEGYEVTVGTAKVALKSLVDEGWLVTGAAREGHRVAESIPDVQKPRLTLEQRVERIERHLGLDD